MNYIKTIVVGNEKGGSGKSTTAMHLTVALMRAGFSVGTIDVDGRQGTLSRYIENRVSYAAAQGISLPMPTHHRLILTDDEAQNQSQFYEALDRLRTTTQYVIVDCPGNDTAVSRFAHTFADILITPLNDSFLDLDVLARVDSESLDIVTPSHYAEMVWEQRKNRAMRREKPIDWIVIRNRLSHLDARNKREMESILAKLSKRVGFRVAEGFSERVIYRELFLKGITLLDLQDVGVDISLTLSHVAARQEIRALFQELGLEELTAVAA